MDETTRLLKEDPRRSSWRMRYGNISLELQNWFLVTDKSRISELMNVAWAGHEITSEPVEEMIRFFDGNDVENF